MGAAQEAALPRRSGCRLGPRVSRVCHLERIQYSVGATANYEDAQVFKENYTIVAPSLFYNNTNYHSLQDYY